MSIAAVLVNENNRFERRLDRFWSVPCGAYLYAVGGGEGYVLGVIGFRAAWINKHPATYSGDYNYRNQNVNKWSCHTFYNQMLGGINLLWRYSFRSCCLFTRQEEGPVE